MDSRDRAAMIGGSKLPVVNFEGADGPWCPKCNEVISWETQKGNPEFCPTCNTELVWEVELPTMWGVCPLCRGKGTHVNPSIDAHGLTGDDFAEDPAFAEDYFNGVYDQPCNECHGRTTVAVADLERCTLELRALYKTQCLEIASMYLEMEAERGLL